jgi:oxalate decarboxylase/phosphoglucose isomerase-like protein (cupin superfamily)
MAEFLGLRPTSAPNRPGELVPVDLERDVPFPVLRLYTITGVPAGEKRGGHAHRKTRQAIFCLRGKIEVLLESREGRETVLLDGPARGLLLEPMAWHEVTCLSEGCVILVLASTPYEEADYIRDHEEFLALGKEG